ncbi:division/cell wall cluster transcriptional repressor MraZ [Euzebya sp.]|uniref:division/cell wall cluster transcriptional repressor MraZ n=1 Tax=Euzebya sp. TaxID=1971409 RepID=UPI003516FCFB
MEDLDTADEFLGTYMHAMDAKGRLVLPAPHRQLLEEGRLVMTLGFDNCLVIHPMQDWQEVSSSLRSMQRGDQHQRRIARAIFSNASKQELDKQGRVSIPPNLRDAVQLTNAVAVIGMGTHIELWSAEEWEAESGISRDAYTNTKGGLGIGSF